MSEYQFAHIKRFQTTQTSAVRRRRRGPAPAGVAARVDVPQRFPTCYSIEDLWLRTPVCGAANSLWCCGGKNGAPDHQWDVSRLKSTSVNPYARMRSDFLMKRNPRCGMIASSNALVVRTKRGVVDHWLRAHGFARVSGSCDPGRNSLHLRDLPVTVRPEKTHDTLVLVSKLARSTREGF